MSDQVFGDKIGRDKIAQSGSYNTFTVSNAEGVSRAEVDAATAELRALIAELTRGGAVAADGSVTDPGAVVAAVEARESHLRALATAIAGGAKDAILSSVRGGVAALIVGLVGRL